MPASGPRADLQRNTRRLLDEATRVLVANPSATMEEIATATELHRSTIYRRYPNREALITALLDAAFEGIVHIVDTAADQPPRPEALRQLCHDLMAYGSQYAFLAKNHRETDRGADPLRLTRLFVRYQRAGVVRADLPAVWLASAFEALAADLLENRRGIATGPDQAAELVYETFFSGVVAGA